MAKLSIVAAIEAATAEDLAEIRERIGKVSSELNTLRQAERLLAAKIEPKDEATVTARGTSSIDKDAILQRAHDFISSKGPRTAKQLGEALGVPYCTVGRVLRKSDWFRTDGRLWRVAVAGD